jgi:hypothetical protein
VIGGCFIAGPSSDAVVLAEELLAEPRCTLVEAFDKPEVDDIGACDTRGFMRRDAAIRNLSVSSLV